MKLIISDDATRIWVEMLGRHTTIEYNAHPDYSISDADEWCVDARDGRTGNMDRIARHLSRDQALSLMRRLYQMGYVAAGEWAARRRPQPRSQKPRYYITGCVSCGQLMRDVYTHCPHCGAHSRSGGGYRVSEAEYRNVL